MLATSTGDPRLRALFGVTDAASAGVRPVVRLPRKDLSPALFGIAVIAAVLILFFVLNGRRTSQVQPAVRVSGPGAVASSAPPPPLLILPESRQGALVSAPAVEVQSPRSRPPIRRSKPAPYWQEAGPPEAPFAAPPPIPSFRPPQPAQSILTDGQGAPRAPFRASPGRLSADEFDGRRRASALANPSLTVPQGTLIPAVLETAFDSARTGPARAIVSRNVRSFDGKNILIPRGSRLIGESRSPAAEDQKSVAIVWTRLMRPDGVTIEMESLATDTLGRGGVTASVDSHFFARVGSFISKAVDTFGQILATRAGPLVILPGNGSVAKPPVISRSKPAPTLKVAAGTSINVFVAHDLDFSTADPPQ